MFDGVVVDTGKVETVLAAGAAREGHCVLLLDTAKYYSSGYRDQGGDRGQSAMTETWSPLEEEGSLGQAEANGREYPVDLDL